MEVRRSLILALVLAVLPVAPLAAQKPRAIARVGFLTPAEVSPVLEAFRGGLREFGYVENQNVVIEYRSAQGQFDRLPGLASELVRLDVDVIVAFVTQASLAAKQATQKVPIVMVGVAAPVGVGLVSSLARPGGNVTGTSSIAADVVGKQFEALRETVPSAVKVAVPVESSQFSVSSITAERCRDCRPNTWAGSSLCGRTDR